MKEEKKSLAVLFGGESSEHKVSCLSAKSVIGYIDKDKYELYTIGITKKGEWVLTNSPAVHISDDTWEKNPENKQVLISPDKKTHGMLVLDGNGHCEEVYLDVVFPVLHGKNGEDGTIQGLLDLAGIPYVGTGTTASAAGMDKTITKVIVGETGVRQAEFFITDRYTFASNPQQVMEEIEDRFNGKYPFFVKPANGGSSVGINKAKNAKELFDALRIAAGEDHKILVEETIRGREIEVAVLGNRHLRVSRIGEILAGNEFYDYHAKYIDERSKTQIIEDLSPEKEAEIQQAALTVYKALDCRGLSRVDFFLDTEDNVIFNEINTMPGFTHRSMYPELMKDHGIGYGELLDLLVELALDERE